jgi:hypothetical protein
MPKTYNVRNFAEWLSVLDILWLLLLVLEDVDGYELVRNILLFEGHGDPTGAE